MTGRPCEYTDAIGDEICEWLANGNSLRTYCTKPGTPGYSTIMQWLRSVEGFAENYTRARQDQAHNDAEQIAEVRQMARDGQLAPDVARVVIDSLKWTAARRLPKVYGDKVELGTDSSAPLIIQWASGDKV